MTLSVTPLISGGWLVKGTDTEGNKGSTILTSDRWDYVLHLRNHEVATEEFDRVVEEFFSPLTDAAAKAKALLAGPTNDYGVVTVGEDIEGVQAKHIELDENGILLRILAETDHSTLLWVGDDKLVAIQV